IVTTSDEGLEQIAIPPQTNTARSSVSTISPGKSAPAVADLGVFDSGPGELSQEYLEELIPLDLAVASPAGEEPIPGGEISPFGVIGTDNRVKISNPQDSPFSQMPLLVIQYGS